MDSPNKVQPPARRELYKARAGVPIDPAQYQPRQIIQIGSQGHGIPDPLFIQAYGIPDIFLAVRLDTTGREK